MSKCPKCGAPASHGPPDGDFQYDNSKLKALEKENGWLKEQLAIAAHAHEKLTGGTSPFGEKAKNLILAAFEGATFSPENLHMKGVPKKPVPLKPGDPGYYCDVCPHAMFLHNPDGSCPCGSNCAVRRENERVEPRNQM